MTWSYRLVDHGDHIALHEAFYSKKGKVQGWTAQPITFVGHSPEDLRERLVRALFDTYRMPVLDEAAELRRLAKRAARRTRPPRCG